MLQGDEEATKGGYKTLNSMDHKDQKDGFRTTMFVLALSSLENIGFVATMASMVLYFYLVMHLDVSASVHTLTIFMGSTYLFSLIAGLISDNYLSTFHTCLVSGLLQLLALMMLTIEAHTSRLHPKTCVKSSCVERSNKYNAVMLYASLWLLAVGSGGVRATLPLLGADQFNRKDPNEMKGLKSFFNWLLLSTVLGVTVGVTVIVWVSMTVDWYWGFFISFMAAFISLLVLASGKPLYCLQAPAEGPIMRIAQVIVVAIKNQSFSLPENPGELYEMINYKEAVSTEEKISHTNQFRFLDKAAILLEGSKPKLWTVCTVTQVEEVKILIRMWPIIASTIITNICLAQLQTFSTQQISYNMKLSLGSSVVPAPSIPLIPLVVISILIPIYEFVFAPLARKITHHITGPIQLQVGVELLLWVISIAISGLLEAKRQNQAHRDPTRPNSVFWISFQFGIFEIANMFTIVGLLKVFYKEAPARMRSLSTSLTWISLSFGYFLSSSIINSVTKRISPSKQGKDLNKNNLNLLYWFLAILGCLNFANHLYWASWYKHKTQDSDSDSEPKPKALKEEITQDDPRLL